MIGNDVYVTRLIHLWLTSFMRDMPHLYVTEIIHANAHLTYTPTAYDDRKWCIRDTTYSFVTYLIYVRHASFICDINHSRKSTPNIHTHGLRWSEMMYTWHASFMCDMPHSCVTWLLHMWHRSFKHTHIHIHTRLAMIGNDVYVTWLIHVWHASFMCTYTAYNARMYGVATISRLLKITSLLCKRAL